MSSGHGVVKIDLLERPIKNISDHGGSQSQFAQRTIENNWNHEQSIWVEYLLTAFSAEQIFIYILALYQCFPYWIKMYCQGLHPLHFDTWDYQRRSMLRKLTLFLDADLIYVSWIITPIFAPSSLMKNYLLKTSQTDQLYSSTTYAQFWIWWNTSARWI